MDIWLKWAKHYGGLGIDPDRICRDGIINEERYSNSSRKVLFIMKEVNGMPNGDLRQLLKNGPKHLMAHNTARWAAGIIRGFPDFETIDNTEAMRDVLTQSAIINLKKASGGAQADVSVINAYAYHDKALLLEQIEQIGPDVIVACGVFDILVWLLDLQFDPDRPIERPIRDKNNNAWVVPFKHPVMKSKEKSYYELKEIMQKNGENACIAPEKSTT